MMISAYMVNCKRPYVGLVTHALGGVAEVFSCDSHELINVNPAPDILFVEWKGESRMMSVQLSQIRKAIAFRDVPIVIISEPSNLNEINSQKRLGIAGVLVTPLINDNIVQIFKEAMKPVGNQPTIDVRLVNPFVAATLDVLKTMAQTQAKRTDVLLKKDYRMMGDISGVIGILGDEIEGTVAITFQEELARQIIANMLGQTVENVSSDDVNDGVGELVNMISGNAKTILSKEGFKFNLALPTIVSGHGHEVAHRPGTPCLVILFQTEDEKPFAVQVAIGN